MPFIDTHCHLDAPAYDDLGAVCRGSEQAGVEAIVAVGTGSVSNRRILALQHQQPAYVRAALGLHPERSDASWEEVEAVLEQLGSHRDRVVALGEVGLPHYALLDGTMSAELARRHEAFLRALVKGAAGHGPAGRSARAARRRRCGAGHRAALPSRREPCSTGTRAVRDTTAAICDAGYFVSVTPEVCYRQRDRDLVRATPLRNLLLETDGPWPYGGEFAGQPTTPALVARVAAEVARLKAVPLEEVRDVLWDNARRLFGCSSSGSDTLRR